MTIARLNIKYFSLLLLLKGCCFYLTVYMVLLKFLAVMLFANPSTLLRMSEFRAARGEYFDFAQYKTPRSLPAEALAKAGSNP
jgi:hypothetical protein